MATIEFETNLWEVLAGRPPGQPLGPDDRGLWNQVAERLNPAKARPVLRAGVEEVHLTSVRGEAYVMLRSPDEGEAAYLRLSPTELELAHLMDGSRTVAALVADFARISGRLAPDQVTRVVADLAGNRMLEELPVESFHSLDRYRQHRGPLPNTMARTLLKTIRGQRMVLANPDRLVGWLYRAGGKLLFTKVAFVLLTAIGLAGLILFGRTWLGGAESVFLVGDSYLQGALLLIVLNVIALASHELGHSLAAKHAGRRVPAVGALLYFGLPSVFVDTTDVWMAGRRARIVTSAAGPMAALTFAGAAQLTGLAVPEFAPLAFKIAFVWYLNSLFNLNPLMALDGYYLFMDWLELPNLRPRAMAMIAGWARRRRPRWSDLDREGKLIAVYAFLAVTWLVIMLNLMVRMWRDRIAGLSIGLWNSGMFARVALVLVVGALFSPFVFAVVGWIGALWKRMEARWRLRNREVDQRRRVEALRGTVLGLLDDSDLETLAESARWAHPRRGSEVISATGPPPVEALVVIEGAVEGRGHDDPPGTIRERATAGDVVVGPEDAPRLSWLTVGTSLLYVPIAKLGPLLGRLSSGDAPVGVVVTAGSGRHTATKAPDAGVHPVGTYPPLTPRPGQPPSGDDERDSRFQRTMFLLLLLLILLAFMTAGVAAGVTGVWTEMPPDRVLLVIEEGEASVESGNGMETLSQGDRRHLEESDRVEVAAHSIASLIYDGGGVVLLCPLTSVEVGRTQRGREGNIQPGGHVDLARGALHADTFPRTTAYDALDLTVAISAGLVENLGTARFLVSTGEAPLSVTEGEVLLNGEPAPQGVEVEICSADIASAGISTTTTTVGGGTSTTLATSTNGLPTSTTVSETTTSVATTSTSLGATTTTVQVTTTVTTPTTTSPPTTVPQTTTTSIQLPPPVITDVRLAPDPIWEDDRACSSRPSTTDVTALTEGAKSVQLFYQVGNAQGDLQMAESTTGTWTATLGPFSPGTVPDPGPPESTIQITVVADNGSGDQAIASHAGTLIRCP